MASPMTTTIRPHHFLFAVLAMMTPLLAGCDPEATPEEAEFDVLDDELPTANHELVAPPAPEAQPGDSVPAGGHEILASEEPLAPRLGQFCYSHAVTCEDVCQCDLTVCQLECVNGIDPNFCNSCCLDLYDACLGDC